MSKSTVDRIEAERDRTRLRTPDDSATSVSARARCRARRRASRSLRGRNGNTSGKTGSGVRATGSRSTGNRGSARGGCVAWGRDLRPERIKRGAQPLGWCIARCNARADDQIGCRQTRLSVTKGLSHQSAQPITRHGIADGASRHRQSEPRMLQAVRTYSDREESVAVAAAGFVSRLEIDLAQHPVRRRKAIGRGRSAQGMSFLRPFARRRDRILRPFAVAMRARNPCVRARRTLLGW